MSSVLQRLPALASTGVGSLPFERAQTAARHATAAYELPFCPQLPRLYGDMIAEWLGADPGGCGWAPDRDRQLPGAWDAFIAAVQARPPAHRAVKLQVTGPVTLAAALERNGRCTGNHADTVGLAAEIATWLAASAADQATALAELGLDVVLIVDEPGLAAAALATDDARVWDPLRQAAAAWGLHVCGKVPWPVIDAAEPDVLSFDIVRHAPDVSARARLVRLVARGGRVMWGGVDPASPQDPATSAGLVASAVAALGPDPSSADVLAGSLLSPSCGTGRLAVESELRVAAIVRAVADAVRAGVRAHSRPTSAEPGHGAVV
jgi:hypothetical protein